MSSYSSGGLGSTYNYDWTGQLIHNNYILIKRLGFGSYAAVWLCYSLRHKKCFAIKILNPEDFSSGLKEIEVFKQVASARSPYILSLIDHFKIPCPLPPMEGDDEPDDRAPDGQDDRPEPDTDSDDVHVCLVLELMLCSVYDVLKLCKKNRDDPRADDTKLKRLPIEFVKKIIRETLQATKVFHRSGIIHTDIKPENMLLPFNLSKALPDINSDIVSLCNSFNGCDVEAMIDTTVKHLRKQKFRNNDRHRSRSDLRKLAISDVVTRMLETKASVARVETTQKRQKKPRPDSHQRHHRGDSDEESGDESYDREYRIDREEISSDDDTDEEPERPRATTPAPAHAGPTAGTAGPTGPVNAIFENVSIKLSDLGTCQSLNKLKYREIQTRHYRAPEVILRLKYNEKCDIWSIACCLYEFLTGRVLFNPTKTQAISCDRYHVCEFISRLGEIPSAIIEESPKKDTFFKRNGFIRGISDPEYNPLWREMEERVQDASLIELMQQMLTYDRHTRPSAEQCLGHEWLVAHAGASHSHSHTPTTQGESQQRKSRPKHRKGR